MDLLPGTEIINSIVGYEDIKPTQLIGKVVQNVKNRSILGLKNISNHEWIASKGSSKNVIPPGKVLVIMDGVEVDFYPENRSITKKCLPKELLTEVDTSLLEDNNNSDDNEPA